MIYYRKEKYQKKAVTFMNDRQFMSIELTKLGITQTELAERLGMTQSAFSNKLARGLTISDCKKIADVLGLQFQYGFVADNNEQVIHETV